MDNKNYYIVYKNDCYDFQKDHGADSTHYDGQIHYQKLIIYNESNGLLIAKGFCLGCRYSSDTSVTPFNKTDVITHETFASRMEHLLCKQNSNSVGCAGIFYCTVKELDDIISILDHYTERERLIYIISQISKYVNSLRVEKERYLNAFKEYNTFKNNHQDDINKILNNAKEFELDDYINDLIPIINIDK